MVFCAKSTEILDVAALFELASPRTAVRGLLDVEPRVLTRGGFRNAAECSSVASVSFTPISPAPHPHDDRTAPFPCPYGCDTPREARAPNRRARQNSSKARDVYQSRPGFLDNESVRYP